MIKTKIFKIDPSRPDPKTIGSCARVIKRGGLVAFPTETVYGLGAKAFDKAAERKIYRVKKRPRAKPLTIQVAGIKTVERLCSRLAPEAKRLAKRFWPGPLTMVLNASSGKKAGFRIPDNKIAISLIRRSGVPLVVPSANLSGKRAAVDAKKVLEYFYGRIDAVLDGGRTHIGVESTVVDMTGKRPRILRHGAIPRADILKTCYPSGRDE